MPPRRKILGLSLSAEIDTFGRKGMLWPDNPADNSMRLSTFLNDGHKNLDCETICARVQETPMDVELLKLPLKARQNSENYHTTHRVAICILKSRKQIWDEFVLLLSEIVTRAAWNRPCTTVTKYILENWLVFIQYNMLQSEHARRLSLRYFSTGMVSITEYITPFCNSVKQGIRWRNCNRRQIATYYLAIISV